MRVYVTPSVSRLISVGTLIASLGLLGWVTWKAVDVWHADPTLQQIQNLLNQDKP